MSGPPSSLIENYLREAGFWHMATIGRECKLDSKLISVLIKRWRPETHTFHLPFIRSVQSGDWEAICYELLGAILDSINGGQIEMGWLRDTFPEPDDDSIELERIR
ncbi:hypothetical protein Gotur_005419, partial [Gossypium turneri]